MTKEQIRDSKECEEKAMNGEDMDCFDCSCTVCIAQEESKPYFTKYEIECLAMAIVNFTNETNGVNVEVRQANNDKCFDHAIEKIKAFINQEEMK